MNLKDKAVKIIVSEPWDWKESLFGIISSDNEKGALLVKLSKPIKGKEITSDLMRLGLRYEKTSFESLSQYTSIAVNGALMKNNRFEFIIIGSVTLV